jgi:hypothetical protein
VLPFACSPKVSDGKLATNAEAEKAGALTAALRGCLTQNKGALAAVAEKQRLCNVPRLRSVEEAGRGGPSEARSGHRKGGGADVRAFPIAELENGERFPFKRISFRPPSLCLSHVFSMFESDSKACT